jgi:hypothetical protein
MNVVSGLPIENDKKIHNTKFGNVYEDLKLRHRKKLFIKPSNQKKKKKTETNPVVILYIIRL